MMQQDAAGVWGFAQGLMNEPYTATRGGRAGEFEGALIPCLLFPHEVGGTKGG